LSVGAHPEELPSFAAPHKSKFGNGFLVEFLRAFEAGPYAKELYGLIQDSLTFANLVAQM
jgi:hypothetical protein